MNFNKLWFPWEPVDVQLGTISENARNGDCYQCAKFHACIKNCTICLKFWVMPPNYLVHIQTRSISVVGCSKYFMVHTLWPTEHGNQEIMKSLKEKNQFTGKCFQFQRSKMSIQEDHQYILMILAKVPLILSRQQVLWMQKVNTMWRRPLTVPWRTEQFLS